jgi:hypothetical protein
VLRVRPHAAAGPLPTPLACHAPSSAQWDSADTWKPNKYRSGSRIEDSRYNDDLREGDAEGVDSVRKVAKHTSVPLSLLTLDNATICSIPQFPNLAQLDQRESSFSRAMIH